MPNNNVLEVRLAQMLALTEFMLVTLWALELAEESLFHMNKTLGTLYHIWFWVICLIPQK